MNILDFALMLHVRMKVTVVERIHPQSNKFAMGVENKGTAGIGLNDSLECYIA